MEDICGEKKRAPRHARANGNLLRLRRQIQEERVAAPTAFRTDAMSGAFPAAKETATIDPRELEQFIERLG